MNILVTGGTGTVGSELIQALLQKGHNILSLVRKSKTSLQTKTLVEISLSNSNHELYKEIETFQPEVVIHLAAYLTSSDDFEEIQKVISSNTLFLCRILSLIKDITPRPTFLYTGSFAEYDSEGKLSPAYFYAASKIAGKAYLNYFSRAYSIKVINIIPYTIYGGNDKKKKVLDIMVESLNHTEELKMSPGYQQLDFIYIHDVVSYYIGVAEHHKQIPDDTELHVGTGKVTSLRDVAKKLEELTDQTCNIVWGACPYRKLDTIYSAARRNTEIESLIGWDVTYSLQDGLSDVLKIKKPSSI
ncbi:NAD-dependent epimerase/dehydratase family protein [Flagellimonas marinaquae]